MSGETEWQAVDLLPLLPQRLFVIIASDIAQPSSISARLHAKIAASTQGNASTVSCVALYAIAPVRLHGFVVKQRTRWVHYRLIVLNI